MVEKVSLISTNPLVIIRVGIGKRVEISLLKTEEHNSSTAGAVKQETDYKEQDCGSTTSLLFSIGSEEHFI